MNPVDLSFRHLEAFVTVARLNSFTGAAKVLHLSQSALTKQVRHLEETWGVRLFDRNTRTVALTRIGKELDPVIAQLMREFEGVVFKTRELAVNARGILRVAALPSLCSTILPTALAQFRALHPGVSIVLRDVVAERVMSMVKAEEVDLGVGSAPGGASEIRFAPLLSDRMVVAFPPEHALQRSKSVKLGQLRRYPLILMSTDSSVRKLVDAAFASVGHLVRPAYEATYMSTAAGMVKAGLGVTIMPSSAIQIGELADLMTRPISHPVITRELGILSKFSRALSPASELFIRIINAVVSSASKVGAR
jgi:DNA-binding transcriptional LysR family regulator